MHWKVTPHYSKFSEFQVRWPDSTKSSRNSTPGRKDTYILPGPQIGFTRCTNFHPTHDFLPEKGQTLCPFDYTRVLCFSSIEHKFNMAILVQPAHKINEGLLNALARGCVTPWVARWSKLSRKRLFKNYATLYADITKVHKVQQVHATDSLFSFHQIRLFIFGVNLGVKDVACKFKLLKTT